MKAAVVYDYNAPPRYDDFADPTPEAGELLVRMSAAALHPVVRSQASGKHYASPKTLPFLPGVDGVGRLEDGRRILCGGPRRPWGTIAELAAVNAAFFVDVPDELDDVTAAAIANPGMSSWAALKWRVQFAAGESVLILGATGSAGHLAVQFAKQLGARRIVAVGRDQSALDEALTKGADAAISLLQPDGDLSTAFQKELKENGVDIVLDYLWGHPAEVLLTSIALSAPHAGAPRIRYAQIGSSAGETIPLPAAILRSTGLELVGSGYGSVSLQHIMGVIGELLQHSAKHGLSVPTETAPLSDVETAWTRNTGGKRLVFQIQV